MKKRFRKGFSFLGINPVALSSTTFPPQLAAYTECTLTGLLIPVFGMIRQMPTKESINTQPSLRELGIVLTLKNIDGEYILFQVPAVEFVVDSEKTIVPGFGAAPYVAQLSGQGVDGRFPEVCGKIDWLASFVTQSGGDPLAAPRLPTEKFYFIAEFETDS